MVNYYCIAVAYTVHAWLTYSHRSIDSKAIANLPDDFLLMLNFRQNCVPMFTSLYVYVLHVRFSAPNQQSDWEFFTLTVTAFSVVCNGVNFLLMLILCRELIGDPVSHCLLYISAACMVRSKYTKPAGFPSTSDSLLEGTLLLFCGRCSPHT